jgi:putative ABC transport system substrate-binding protein
MRTWRASAIFALALLVAPPPVRADNPRLVGIVANTVPLREWTAPSLPDGGPHAGQAMREGLEKLGWVDGKNIRIVWRSAEGDFERLPAIFEELARMPVDVIVAVGPGASAALKATSTIPIVMAVSASTVGPVVESLSRPGRNITGLSFETPRGLFGKRLELLKLAVPKAARVVALVEGETASKPSRDTQAAADKLGIDLVMIAFRTVDDLERAFAEVVAARPDAVLVTDGVWVHRRRFQQAVNSLAARHRLPIMHTASDGADTGGLLAYGIDTMAQYRRIPYFVDRILKGAKPSTLPVEQPATLTLTLNIGTAKALGLVLPAALRIQADRVIE